MPQGNAIPAGTKQNCVWLTQMYLSGSPITIPPGYKYGTSTNMKVQRVILRWLVALLSPGKPNLQKLEQTLIDLLKYQITTAFMAFNGVGGLAGTEQMTCSHAIHHHTPLGVALWFALEEERSSLATWLTRWWVAYAALCVAGSTPDHGVVLAAPRSNKPSFGPLFGTVRREERDDMYQVLVGISRTRYRHAQPDLVGNLAIDAVQREHPQALKACRNLTLENCATFFPTLAEPILVQRHSGGHVSMTVRQPLYGIDWAVKAWAHYGSGKSGSGDPPQDLGMIVRMLP